MPSAWPAFRGQPGALDARLWDQWFRASGGQLVRLVRHPSLGQQQRRPAERPTGLIGRPDAAEAARQLDRIAETAPECFEGEDLTAARGLTQRLKDFAGSDRSLMDLTDEDERILKRGQDCFAALERGAPRPEAKSATAGISPVVPIAIGAGVGAAILLLLLT